MMVEVGIYDGDEHVQNPAHARQIVDELVGPGRALEWVGRVWTVELDDLQTAEFIANGFWGRENDDIAVETGD